MSDYRRDYSRLQNFANICRLTLVLPSNLEIIRSILHDSIVRSYHPSNSCRRAKGTGRRGKNQIGKRDVSSMTAVAVTALRSALTRTLRHSWNTIFASVFEYCPKRTYHRQNYSRLLGKHRYIASRTGSCSRRNITVFSKEEMKKAKVRITGRYAKCLPFRKNVRLDCSP